VNAALSPLAGFAASDTPEDGTRPPESAPRVSEGVSASSRQNVAHDRGDGAVGKTDVPAMRDVSAGEKKKQEGGRSSFEILSVGPLTHPALLQYLTIRGIDHEVARRYLSQIDFTAPERRGTYFALGYPAGEGYEARNALFKGFVGTGKSVTFHDKPGARILQVFEGVMDFLSLLTMDGETQPAGSVLVLNSTALWERALPYIDDGRYDEVRLYLDNDAAGDAATAKLFAAAKTPARLADMRAHYRGYDDLNAWLTVTTM
jgi:hypothetical protein